MGVFDIFSKNRPAPKEAPENQSIRKIIAELEHLPGEEAKYLAAFAYLLGRVAHADLDISDEETQKMEEVVREMSGMNADQAILIVQIAKSQNILFGATENYLVAREFKKLSDPKQRESLLHCLFAVAGVDDEITGVEEEEIRQIGKELGFRANELINIRLQYRDKLSVLKNLPGKKN
jgi:uncharacterized tellurite resistance protein B-like protein